MAERGQNKKILVAGAGGREHALCWALAKSALVDEVLCTPGNGGTAAEKKVKNIPPRPGEGIEEAALRIAHNEQCDFAVIGPEDPLAHGLADSLRAVGIPAVGPGKEGAALEASKDFAKRFMAKHGVACAKSETFDCAREARQFIQTLKGDAKPIVVKADGLAAGKGVVVAPNVDEALNAVRLFMEEGQLGSAGKKIVIEEFLEGVEYSVLAAVSVTKDADKRPCIKPFVSARDHKRLETGNKGPNTGGMGAIAPADGVTDSVLEEFDSAILRPTLNGLIAENIEYQGFIFFGVMLTASGSKLLEYNVRLGDPETQAVLPLFAGDFAELCLSIIEGKLASYDLAWKSGAVCAPVLVSGGYPASYKTGFPITLGGSELEGVKIFVSGARNADNSLVTSGGRVLTVAAHNADAQSARLNAYNAIRQISFNGMYYRADIGGAV
jgi:phosphoribosylamine--glycine ligase